VAVTVSEFLTAKPQMVGWTAALMPSSTLAVARDKMPQRQKKKQKDDGKRPPSSSLQLSR
jgi:hypothetical protein